MSREKTFKNAPVGTARAEPAPVNGSVTLTREQFDAVRIANLERALWLEQAAKAQTAHNEAVARAMIAAGLNPTLRYNLDAATLTATRTVE